MFNANAENHAINSGAPPLSITPVVALAVVQSKKRKREEQVEPLTHKLLHVENGASAHSKEGRKIQSKVKKINKYCSQPLKLENIAEIYSRLIAKQNEMKPHMVAMLAEYKFQNKNYEEDVILAIPKDNPEIYLKWKNEKIANSGLNEQFAYRCALILDMADVMVPTTLMKIDNKKMVIQLALKNEGEEKSAPMNNYINALIYELFLGLNDSHDLNIFFKNQNFVHFDCENAPENNPTNKPTFDSDKFDILRLPQATTKLSNEEIQHLSSMLERIKLCFPEIKQLATDTLHKSNWSHWEGRVDRMLASFLRVQSGEITTMMDYHLSCMPAFKSDVYAAIWFHITTLPKEAFKADGTLQPDRLERVQKAAAYAEDGDLRDLDFGEYTEEVEINTDDPEYINMSFHTFVDFCAKRWSDFNDTHPDF